MIRIVKVIRTMKALNVDVELQRWIMYSRNAHLFRLSYTVTGIIAITHLMSCIWAAIGQDMWYETEMKMEMSAEGYDDVLCCCDFPERSDWTENFEPVSRPPPLPASPPLPPLSPDPPPGFHQAPGLRARARSVGGGHQVEQPGEELHSLRGHRPLQ